MIQENIMLFSEYIQHAKDLILRSRTDLTPENTEEIVNAVAPFECNGEKSTKNGVLLAHGLFDTPFMLNDIGQHFKHNDYLVRAILLPGHGTQPKDLLNVSRKDWLNTVEYGIKSMTDKVENLYLVGYSLGGALSILQSTIADNIKGLILIAPAVKPKHKKAHILHYHKLFTWISEKWKWYINHKTGNFIRYAKHPYHAGHHAILTMRKAKKAIINLPVLMVASEDDETISGEAIYNYFQKLPNPKNHLIYYTNSDIKPNDSRIEIRTSSFPNENIIDFSHRCLPISPSNYYLGRESMFEDFAHYENGEHESAEDIKKGSVSIHNLANHTMQRLSYNPDFDYLVSAIDEFIART